MEAREEEKLLNTLKSIDSTLKRIEQDLKSRPLNSKEMFEETLSSAGNVGKSALGI